MWVFITDEVTSGNHYPWIYLGFFWVKHGCLYEYLILSICKKSLTSNLRKTKAICVPRLYIFYSVITIEIFVTFWIFSYFCFGHISYSNSGFCLRFSDIAVFEKDAFSFFHEHGTKKKFWVPMTNGTSDLQIPRSDARNLKVWDFSWGLRIFSFSHARDGTKRHFSLFLLFYWGLHLTLSHYFYLRNILG